MEIHKPKPWHGFREFLKEYLIVVVGVLTALGAEQVAEWVHWRHETEVARDALRYDLRRALGWSAATDAEAPCVLARLQTLSDALDQAGQTKRLTPISPFPSPQGHSWNLRSWSALVAGQTLSHMPNREQTLLSGISARADYMFREQTQSAVDWHELQGMAGTGRSVSDTELASFNSAFSRVAGYRSDLQAGARQTPTLIIETGLLSAHEVKRAWDEGLAAGRLSGLCTFRAPPEPRRATLGRMFRVVPVQPGAEKLDTLGVGGAVSTDR